MKKHGLAATLALCVVAMVGCNSSNGGFGIAPVSGKVTIDGEPVAGAVVSMMPVSTGEDANAGPFSEAVTDSNGGFTMVTRYGDEGAVVGNHIVSIAYAGMDQQAMDDSGDPDADESENQTVRDKMNLKTPIPDSWGEDSTNEFTVPAGGTDAANFELNNE